MTTALASNAGTAFAGINTAQTNVTWTINSSGISINAGAYARTGVTTTTASVFSATLNTSGLRIEMPPYITNGVQQSETTKFAGLGFTTGSTGGTAIVGTLSTNGLSIRVPSFAGANHSLFFNDSNGITWGSATAGSSTTITADFSSSRYIQRTETGSYILLMQMLPVVVILRLVHLLVGIKYNCLC